MQRLKSLPELRTRIKIRMNTDLAPWNFYVSNGHFDTIKNRFVSIDEYEKDRFIIPVSPVPYDPDATCPNFDKWLEELFEGDFNAEQNTASRRDSCYRVIGEEF